MVGHRDTAARKSHSRAALAALAALSAFACGGEPELPPCLEFDVAEVEHVTADALQTTRTADRVATTSPRQEVALAGIGPAPSAPRGKPLVIVADHAAAELVEAPLRTAIRRACPDRELRLSYDIDRRAIDEVLRGRADLALVASRPEPQHRRHGATLRVLGYHVTCVVVHAGNGLRSLTDVQIAHTVSAGEPQPWQSIGGRGDGVDVFTGPRGARRLLDGHLLAPGRRFGPVAKPLGSDAEVLAEVARNANAMGIVSLASVNRSRRRLPVVALQSIPPALSTAATGRYSGSRPVGLVHASGGSPVANAVLAQLAAKQLRRELARELTLTPAR